PGGEVEFIGRRDEQVKLRGFRIELGEVEGVLAAHAAVREAVVMARDDGPRGEKALVAYVRADDGARLSVAELRKHLSERLPEYMVPAAYVMLDAMPLNANGKVDRRALPAPDWARGGRENAERGVRTPVEELLRGIWAEVLGIEASGIGTEDDFFELGGHSLIATLVISRIREIFKVELSLRVVFQWPTLRELAEQVEAAMHAGESVQALPMERVSREGGVALSFAQQRLWFLNQMEPDNPFYNVPLMVHMSGALDTEVLQPVLNEIIRRHETLRTTFINVNGEPAQIIGPPFQVGLNITELQHLPFAEREAEMHRLLEEESRRPFNLADGPLLRAGLLRIAEDEHVLLLTVHHIVSDGWSMDVLMREMATLYGAFSVGEKSPLEELTIQYADFAHWQRQWLSDETLQSQLSYWKRQLAGASGVLELPTDRPRPPIQQHRGAIAVFDLPLKLTEQIKELNRQSGATLYMTLLAAFKVLLSRYTGQQDIVVGSPIANRNRAEVEPLIGFFVNASLLRTDLSGDPTFEELLGRVREVALEAYAHQDVPFEKLVEELQPERDLSRHPLFQVIFALQNASAERFNLPGLKLKTLPIDNHTSMFDLTLMMEERPEGLSGLVQYNTDLFDGSTITRMMGHFRMLLEGIVENPSCRLSQLPLLTPQHRQQLLLEFNDTCADYERDETIQKLFEAQVAQTPDAVAVEFQEQRLTYAELNARANQLAHHLQGLGVGPETLVGLCVERSMEMVVAVLGILKAGGAYLPLDLSYPKERLELMLADARVQVLLTHQNHAAALPGGDVLRVLRLDADRELWARASVENPVSETRALNQAYVMYTSGSTGTPKGISVPHRAVCRLVRSTNFASFSPRHTFLQLAPI
ncbi:MAG: hypothetical protein QOJ70_1671, partial [Acidobacteriota bacterium]|nr:hypothetical protein [Acidobacteriota bacterium]